MICTQPTASAHETAGEGKASIRRRGSRESRRGHPSKLIYSNPIARIRAHQYYSVQHRPGWHTNAKNFGRELFSPAGGGCLPLARARPRPPQRHDSRTGRMKPQPALAASAVGYYFRLFHFHLVVRISFFNLHMFAGRPPRHNGARPLAPMLIRRHPCPRPGWPEHADGAPRMLALGRHQCSPLALRALLWRSFACTIIL